MSALTLGTFAVQTQANAATTIDSNHVVVEKNDTLSEIAHDFNTTVDALVQENKIENKHMIHVGDKLTLPNKTKADTDTQTINEGVQVATPTVQQPVQSTNNVSTPVTATGSSAKEWIAQRESGGDYNARNGRYVGRYQLDAAYLNGDYSPENQERAAQSYMEQRYGSWEAAQDFWQSHNWW